MATQTCGKTCSNSFYPMSLVQEEIWLSQMIYTSVPLYNIGGNVKINGFIDTDAFIETHRMVTRQNDAFRMVFHKGDTLPGFSFSDKAQDIELKDFTGCTDPDTAAMQWWQKQFVKPFEIHDAQMSRYYLLKTSEQSFYYAVCAHHLTMDGYCFAILNQRLLENYNYLVKGTGQTGDKPSYVDFIPNDREYRESDEFRQAKQYWTDKFATLPGPVIPRRYAAQFETRATPSAFSHIWLEPDFYYQLISYSKQRRGNVFFLMAAVLYTYFLKTCDAPKFVFSIPLLNRPSLEFMDTMGPFVNVVPVCLDFGLDIDIQTFFDRLKGELKESFPHQRFPLGEINRAAKLNQTGRNQIFDVSLSYEKFDYDVMDYNGTKFEINTMHNGWDQTPLTLAIKEYQKKTGVKLEFYYNLAAFRPIEIEFLMERIRFLLEQIIEHPDIPLSRLKILPEQESKKLLTDFNGEPGPAATPFQDICQKFKAAVKIRPDHDAVQMGDRGLSYQVLDDRSNRLAAYLAPLLDKEKPFVGIFVHRSLEMVVGILAVLKAGGAYIPLDPEYPEDRINFMIEDSGAQVILTRKKLEEKIAAKEDKTIVYLADFAYDREKDPEKKKQKVEPADQNFAPDHLAYVIYTSGTTGQPKGVMCTHGGFANLVDAQNKIFAIDRDSRVLQFASLCFDASVSEIFTALAAGATLVLARKDDLMPGPSLIDTLERETITHVTLPPSALSVMEPVDLPGLGTLVTAGEPCPSKLFEKWGRGRRFINAYGPTEATVCACAEICSCADFDQLPMGKPIDNVSLYVLDDNLGPVPVGVPGQLYIGGVSLAKGYLNRPELTREKFIDNPFSRKGTGERLYRTGDMVRFVTDSTLMFMGRCDHQVKVRGFRIEPEEVEKVIAGFPEISEAAVIAKQKSLTQVYLAAFFSCQEKSPDDNLVADIRQYARKSLPDYMVPALFIHMDEMPHTPNGKLDRKALEHAEPQALSSPEKQTLPASSTEKTVMDLFYKAMDMDDLSIGPHDDFFEAGMDSLAAVRYLGILEKAFNHRLLFSELMANSTAHVLAGFFEKNGGLVQIERQKLVSISSDGEKTPFFCITAGYGDVVKMQHLSRHLGKDQPFFMLQPDDVTRALDVSDLARAYMAEIERQCPMGPYRLGGYSAGGLMAYETARLFAQNGQDVELLVMIGAPMGYSRFARSLNKKLTPLVLKFLPDCQVKISSGLLEILRAVFLDHGLQYHLETLTGYRPKGYRGKIDYFQGKWALSRFLGTHRSWMKLARGPFDLHMLPGNHDSFMREPHVAQLARRLKLCINALDRTKGVT